MRVAILTAALTVAALAHAGQWVTLLADSTNAIDLQPARVAALVVLSLVMRLVVPVQVFSLCGLAPGACARAAPTVP